MKLSLAFFLCFCLRLVLQGQTITVTQTTSQGLRVVAERPEIDAIPAGVLFVHPDVSASPQDFFMNYQCRIAYQPHSYVLQIETDYTGFVSVSIKNLGTQKLSTKPIGIDKKIDLRDLDSGHMYELTLESPQNRVNYRIAKP